jgi:hypothetical protein
VSGQGLGDGPVLLDGLFRAGESVMVDNCPVTHHHFAYLTTRMDHCFWCKGIDPGGPVWAEMDGASIDTVSG